MTEQPVEGVERYYSPATLGRRLDLRPDMIRSLVRRGELRAVHFGRTVRIPESAVREFLAGRSS